MNQLKIALFLFLSVFFTTAFALNQITTYGQDKTGIVVTPKNQRFIIKLQSNPSTGFSWFVREYDSSLLTAVSQKYVPPGDKKLIGEAGYELWTFQVKSQAFMVPQQTTIRFVYSRPWEGNDEGSQVVFRVSTTTK
jgi:inhibitor of cysteine peptidase